MVVRMASKMSVLLGLFIKRNLKTISPSGKLINQSANRNQGSILEVLKGVLNRHNPGLKLLEISSGTGQHLAYFAKYFPNITFQPSEYDRSMMSSIQAYGEEVTHKNVQNPTYIDITTDFEHWNERIEEESLDYMLNINMIHISPWSCTEGLFRNAGRILKKQGLLITYGPYAENGNLVPDSNVRFDSMLRSQNPEWGVRDLRDLKKLAGYYGITLRETYEMPSNNKTVIWIKN